MILIVDDNPENIFSLKKLLESKSFDVDTASSGEEALKKALKHSYSLIILDVQMPGMDGFFVAEALSGYSKTKGIPIIFLSAVKIEKRFISKGYNSGALDYVTKPVDPDILFHKINTFLRLSEQTISLQETKKALEQEIERRKEAETALINRLHYLDTILESLPQIAFKINDLGEINFVNKQWYEYSTSAKVFPDTCPQEKEISELVKEVLESGEELEVEVLIKNISTNSYHFHLLRIIPFLENSQERNWVGTFTDIDAQKRIEKEKDEFLSIASHELKTPLTSIKAYLQLMDRKLDLANNAVAAGFLSKALGQAEKLSGLISDLLDISKLENGQLKIIYKVFNFEQMINEAVENIYQMRQDSNVEIIRQGDIIDFEFEGDQVRIEQVLINFLSNAIKYSPNSKSVIINTVLSDSCVTVNVIDSGIGIPLVKQTEIFKKFYRVEESSLKFQGLGVGLYICAEIIKKHNGTIGVISEEGNGSTFYFTLPLNKNK